MHTNKYLLFPCSLHKVNYDMREHAEWIITSDQGGAHSVSTGEILPVGTYTIKESKTNKWYEMNTAWSDTARYRHFFHRSKEKERKG